MTNAAKKMYLNGFQETDKVPRKTFFKKYISFLSPYTWDCAAPMSARGSNILEPTQI